MLATTASALGHATPALGALRCGLYPQAPHLQICEAGIESSIAHISAQQAGSQFQSQWCWAACIAMIFAYYGVPVSQQRIVQETWGRIMDLPATMPVIMGNINRDWRSDRGEAFRSFGDVYSANPMTAAQDLAANMPLIIGTQGHAMVLTSLVYLRDQWGAGRVTSAVVRDPWPGQGRRELSASEWYGTNLLARVRVRRL